MTSDESFALVRLANELVQREADPGEVHPCPICGGELHVYFASYKQGTRLGVHLQCHSCGKMGHIDYKSVPTWLKDLTSDQDAENVVRQMHELFRKKL
jgi:hypothetical protein